jgi:hypothetical protein
MQHLSVRPAPRIRDTSWRDTCEMAAGMLVGVLVCLGVPMLRLSLPTNFAVTPAVTGPCCLLAGSLLLLRDRTRSWGRGLLTGVLLSLVILAAVVLMLLPGFPG